MTSEEARNDLMDEVFTKVQATMNGSDVCDRVIAKVGDDGNDDGNNVSASET
jgi:hypothetical protein